MASKSRKIFGFERAIIFALTICYILYSTDRTYAQQLAIEDPKPSDQFTVGKRAGNPGGMWFGPRLGKRSHVSGSSTGGISLPMQRLLLEAAMMNGLETVDDVPESMEPIFGSKRRFTPRLGRDSSEQEVTGSSRNVDFIPRLGRELSPGLLRALGMLAFDNEYASESLYGRATGDERAPAITETRIPPFAPRLGRHLNFQMVPLADASIYGAPRYARSAESKKAKADCVAVKKTSSTKP